MAKEDRQTLFLKRAREQGSCVPLCDYMINYTVISPMSERFSDGSMRFSGGELDPEHPDQADPLFNALVFEGLSGGFLDELDKLARYARVLAPLKDPLLGDLKASLSSNILTFGLDDNDANFFAQNIRKGPEGYSFELVYDSSLDKGKSLITKFVSGYDKNIFLGVSIGSTDINDVLNSVVAFACASMMGVDPRHIRDALARYAFPSRPREVKQEVTKEDILSMREFEED